MYTRNKSGGEGEFVQKWLDRVFKEIKKMLNRLYVHCPDLSDNTKLNTIAN